jgi:hypothetical protein
MKITKAAPTRSAHQLRELPRTFGSAARSEYSRKCQTIAVPRQSRGITYFIYIPRAELPPPLIARLIRLAAFQNPEFYAAQAMRRSTHDKPRIVSCAELTSHHIVLTRGCFDAACGLLASLGAVVAKEDRRVVGAPISLSFIGNLRPDQETAVAALSPHDTGVARQSWPFA